MLILFRRWRQPHAAVPSKAHSDVHTPYHPQSSPGTSDVLKALIDTSRKIAARKIAIVFHSRRASPEGLRTLASARKLFSEVW